MKSKHTEGPWNVEKDDSGQWQIRGNDGFSVTCINVDDDHYGRPEEEKANAYLIAAAPEMYEALKGIFQAQAPNFNFDFSKHPYMQAMVDAIKKAEGKS